ncbi:Bgt-20158 [Blumeria graminis f. sp. tritici]|uniref:Bgt-20158 n=2 Tax=Blumeria graminis f. sp. tritici TaxID=62690 RepID=A0A381LBN8_BLUGR|nr:Bgt-20158 [Blumeria graminis f. sp. tritici]
MCPSYPDSNWQTGQDNVPPHHSTMAMFKVSPALWQSKTWHAQSSIYKISLPIFKLPRPSRLYPYFASSYRLIMIPLTPIPKNSFSDFCATLCFLRWV